MPPDLPAHERPRVLLVEDELLLSVTLGDELLEHAFDVTICADGEDALRRLAGENFDAVVSDLRLPGADGLEVLRAARARSPAVRLLLTTAYADRTQMARLRAADAGLLTKPFHCRDLLAWLVDGAA